MIASDCRTHTDISQLAGHKHIRPKAIHDKDIVDEFSKDYMYLACIQFVDSVSVR